jgi:hypothetical protein
MQIELKRRLPSPLHDSPPFTMNVSRYEPEGIRFASVEPKPNLPLLPHSYPLKLLLFRLLRRSNVTPVLAASVPYRAKRTLVLRAAEKKRDLKERSSKAQRSSCNIKRFHCGFPATLTAASLTVQRKCCPRKHCAEL